LAVSLDRHTRVREPISSMLYLPSTARSEREVWHRVDELVGEFGLAQYRDTPTSDLSTGTRRILELACVAGHQPKLLLLDEPSSGLSQLETEGMADVIREIRKLTGATVAIIEHDVPLVSSLADELVCMNLGSVICRGLPDDVLRNQVVIDAYLGIH
jgi:ABC-type branched-subunit amino acid transport system ATPase component